MIRNEVTWIVFPACTWIASQARNDDTHFPSLRACKEIQKQSSLDCFVVPPRNDDMLYLHFIIDMNSYNLLL